MKDIGPSDRMHKASSPPGVYTPRGGAVQDGGLIEIKKNSSGVKEFHAGVVQLAFSIFDRPQIQRACLVMVNPRLSRDRLLREWRAVQSVFVNDVASRLSLAVVDKNGVWTEPEDKILCRVVQSLNQKTSDRESSNTVAKSVAGRKYYEIVKVLLCRWLQKEGAIPIGRLAEQAGCTYPTAALALKRLERGRNLLRNTNRSVELRKFPREPWNELVALSHVLRQPLRYADASGEKVDPQRLLERLNRMNPPRIALGGVAAARFWDADFDLHGTPRLDLVVLAPDGRMDLSFLKRLDPALQQTESDSQAAAVVVHPLIRPESLFQDAAVGGLPYADPVETVLDLLELGLTVQADQLLAHFRPGIRLL